MAFTFPSRVVTVLSPLGVVIDSPERDSRVPRSRTILFIPTLQLLASGNMVRLSRRGTGPTRVIDGSSLLAGCLARHPTPGQAWPSVWSMLDGRCPLHPWGAHAKPSVPNAAILGKEQRLPDTNSVQYRPAYPRIVFVPPRASVILGFRSPRFEGDALMSVAV